jgi:hypothetical protein
MRLTHRAPNLGEGIQFAALFNALKHFRDPVKLLFGFRYLRLNLCGTHACVLLSEPVPKPHDAPARQRFARFLRTGLRTLV